MCLLLLCVTRGEDVDPADFEEKVVQDKYVWLVEFSSSMCGSCQEFAPEWEKLTGQLKRVRTMHVSIDDDAGKALAQDLGVLEEGIPNVKLFMKAGDASSATTLLKGGDGSARQLKLALKPLLKGLDKEGGDGKYLKGEGGLLWVKSDGQCVEHKWCQTNIPRSADDQPHDNCGGWMEACPCTCLGFVVPEGAEPASASSRPPKPDEPARKVYLGKHIGAIVDSLRKYDTFVAADEKVWLLEFYSGRSGESKQFSRTWEALASGLKRVQAGTVDIDTVGGRAIADKLNVMKQGLPNVQLLHRRDAEPTVLMAGELRKKKALRAALKPHLADLEKDDLGNFLKAEDGDPAPDEL